MRVTWRRRHRVALGALLLVALLLVVLVLQSVVTGVEIVDVDISLGMLRDLAQHLTVAVPHGDHEVGPEEHGDLGYLDHFLVVHVAHRLENDEQDIAVRLQLGALMCLDRVLDR